jgi:O-antigen/teichoic acid export membrane protein
MNSVLRSAIARTASFVPIAIATLITSRLIIQHFGVASFDRYALILSLIFLIPLNNLGVGASITTAYAADGPQDEHSQRVTLTAARVLTISSLATIAASLALGFSDVWSTLLGKASGPSLSIGLAIAIYAVSFVPGLGQSMLLGLHRNHTTILVQTLFAPLILIGVAVVVVLDASDTWVLIIPAAAVVVVSLVVASTAARASGTSWLSIARAVPNRRHFPGARIRQLSGPVLISTLATPIALQSDRIVLSHVSTERAVAQYSVLIQIIAPALALIAASAQPLWPIFARARAGGGRAPSLGRTVLLFCAAAGVVGAVLALVANPVAVLIGGEQMRLGVLLPITGALAVVTFAATYPVSMNLMDPAGARFVAITTVIALPVNIGLSIVLGMHLGAPGPLLGSVIVGLFIQTFPGMLYARNRRHIGKHRPSTVGQSTGLTPLLETPPTVLDALWE